MFAFTGRRNVAGGFDRTGLVCTYPAAWDCDGKICFYVYGTAHLVIEISGWFTDA